MDNTSDGYNVTNAALWEHLERGVKVSESQGLLARLGADLGLANAFQRLEEGLGE